MDSSDGATTFIPNITLADELLDATCVRLGFDVKKVRQEIETRGVQGFVVSLVFSLISRPVENMFLAGAITIWDLYRNCPTQIVDYANLYKNHLRPDVYSFLIRHSAELQPYLTFEKDFDNIYFSIGTMIGTYLAKLSYDQAPMEVPQMALLRIAAGQFCMTDNPVKNCLQMYSRYAKRELVPSSPTIFNEGFSEGAPISCMIYTHDDSMDDILHIIYEAGMASKNSAGLGIDFTNLRHSAIGRKGLSQGVIPLLKIWDDLLKYITQGGIRNGAGTASLRDFHYDTTEFVQLLDKTNEDQVRVTRLNLSIMLSDLFMKKVYYPKSQEDGVWYLFCPKQAKELVVLHGKAFEEKYDEMKEHAERWNRFQKYQSIKKLRTAGHRDIKMESMYLQLEEEFKGKPEPRRMNARKVEAKSLMKTICDTQKKTGGPYIVYSCSVNRKNSMSNVGPVRSSNLCQETMIPAVPREETGSCNLASVSLVAFASKPETNDKIGSFDFVGFGQTVQETVVGLNQIIDTAVNVSSKVKKSNDQSRPLGIGVSGFADMLHTMNLSVTDPAKIPMLGEQVDYSASGLLRRKLNPVVDELNWKIWSCMYWNALKSSMEQAKIYGPCPKFYGSPASEGRLQFHFWKEEALETGRKYPFRLNPAEPSEWGQEGSWSELIEDIKIYGIRNLLLLSVQPTASSAQIIGNCESIEFHMSNIYNRKVLSGEYPVLNLHMVRDFEEIGEWNKTIYNNIVNHDGSVLSISEDSVLPEHVPRLRAIKEKYLTMWEIPQRIMVMLAAQRQVFICQSQSMNLFIADPTIDQLMAVHKYTWEMGLKTGMYYLRTKASAEPLKIGKEKAVVSASKTQMVDEIRTAALGIKVKGIKDLNVVEYHDLELIALADMARTVKEKEEEEIRSATENIIVEALISASRPTVAPACEMKPGCIMCT